MVDVVRSAGFGKGFVAQHRDGRLFLVLSDAEPYEDGVPGRVAVELSSAELVRLELAALWCSLD